MVVNIRKLTAYAVVITRKMTAYAVVNTRKMTVMRSSTPGK